MNASKNAYFMQAYIVIHQLNVFILQSCSLFACQQNWMIITLIHLFIPPVP